ncbi:MAG: hypothetical protein ACTSPB_22375, partial [Candidatus Thorarchaeota archaeon]
MNIIEKTEVAAAISIGIPRTMHRTGTIIAPPPKPSIAPAIPATKHPKPATIILSVLLLAMSYSVTSQSLSVPFDF